jgi:Ala-tRNA(Pro) deacylase
MGPIRLVISHSVAYTAQGIAVLTHTPGKELAKTVIVMVDGRLAMPVVPGSVRVDLNRLKKYLAPDSAELANEYELRDRFPDCETGSMPPFGNLYGMCIFRGLVSGRGQGNRLQGGFAPGISALIAMNEPRVKS